MSFRLTGRELQLAAKVLSENEKLNATYNELASGAQERIAAYVVLASTGQIPWDLQPKVAMQRVREALRELYGSEDASVG